MGRGPSPPEQRHGDVARVTAASYKATHELDGRFGVLVLIFIMKRAIGSMQCLIWYKIGKKENMNIEKLVMETSFGT